MSLDRYNRFVVRSTEISCWAIVIVAACMWVAAVADRLLPLGWGWDVQIIWIAPILIGGTLLTRTLCRLVFRRVDTPR